ncbi:MULTISPECIES: YoaK family protein [unclassified Acinetobacter]|uniref:YoaK family protein n=1 Tax=unclassified Acinetobacter TaxID=196816 RepID=UPI002934ED0B|nr:MULTISPECIES: YoaK family protein [unclassified Acinetobacter]WOE32309.1 YoaK family protein [Acinetobacter sp. SAAs470]WOE37780.1 YoaK family protein [Acinetobacter sp. SAAs474]
MPFQTLPYWLQLGTFFLAINAGMINVLGLITVLHQSVSHMTGNVSIFAMAVIDWNTDTLLYLLLVVICYVIGSFYSGLILGSSNFKLGRLYGLPMSLVALFIFTCWFLLPYFPRYSLLWACTAMGIQNAMISHYKGTIIRTTHLSGVLTDLGLALGYKLRGIQISPKRIVLHLLILFGFLLGGIIAASVAPLLKLNAFLVPAGLSLSLSLIYWIIYFRHQSAHQ